MNSVLEKTLTHIDGAAGINPAEGEDAQREFRRTLGQFATGVTAMTTRAPDGAPVGMTVSSFNSLSLDPPLILWSIARSTPSFGYFQVGHDFAVNVLSADQEAVARRLAKSSADKFDGISARTGLGGVPLIDGCIAYLECNVWARYPGGDHDIIVGRVRRIFNIGKAPLLFHGGAFRSF
ncbi:MAG: flavin reductase family protein [Rhodospirillaceae bacterium]|nr:flavin reductase family protein [Rhodospirillaceae bacterium]